MIFMLWIQLAFKHNFYHKQQDNKYQKSNQHFEISFVVYLVYFEIFSVGNYHSCYKGNKKQQRKKQLAGTKHRGENFEQI